MKKVYISKYYLPQNSVLAIHQKDVGLKETSTLTMEIAAETGSLSPRTVHTKELSEPAGIIPIGIEIASFWLSLLSKPFKTCI